MQPYATAEGPEPALPADGSGSESESADEESMAAADSVPDAAGGPTLAQKRALVKEKGAKSRKLL